MRTTVACMRVPSCTNKRCREGCAICVPTLLPCLQAVKVPCSRCSCCSRAIERFMLTCRHCSSTFHIDCLAEALLGQQQQQGMAGSSMGSGTGSSSSMPVAGRCVSCGGPLVWLELLAAMQPFGAGTAEGKAHEKGRGRSRWVLREWGRGRAQQVAVVFMLVPEFTCCCQRKRCQRTAFWRNAGWPNLPVGGVYMRGCLHFSGCSCFLLGVLRTCIVLHSTRSFLM